MKPDNKKFNWVKRGLLWGGLMFLAMSVVIVITFNVILGAPFSFLHDILLLSIPMWVIAGLTWGILVKKSLNKRPK